MKVIFRMYFVAACYFYFFVYVSKRYMEHLHVFSRPVEAVRVYRFPVFEKSFCEELVEELEHFEKSSAPKGRPNTMNHYGVMSLRLLDI